VSQSAESPGASQTCGTGGIVYGHERATLVQTAS